MNTFILRAISLALLSSVMASCDNSNDMNTPSQATFNELDAHVSQLDAQHKQDQDTIKSQGETLATKAQQIADNAEVLRQMGMTISELKDLATQPTVSGIDLKTLRPTFQIFSPAKGYFRLNPASRIVVDSTNDAFITTLSAPMGWVQKLRYATGLKLEVVKKASPAPGDIILSATPDASLLSTAETAQFRWNGESKPIKDTVLKEGYTYEANDRNLTLTYNNPLGAIHALQTVYQLLGSDQLKPGEHHWLPAGRGIDYPLNGYRGLMIDVGRQFVSVPDLIGIMDKMSYYKLNTLHLHLSDNVGDGTAPQGGPNGYLRLYDDTMPEDMKALKPKDSPSDGADRTYYTKADIKLLEAAGARYGIEILPEIDTPGHSYAFTNAFPQFATAGDHSVVDTSKPEAVAFLTKAMIEFGGWFASKKFHVGGDEAYGLSTSQLHAFLEKLKDDLIAAGIGTEMTGAWNDWGSNGGPDDNFTIFNWTKAYEYNLDGKSWIDVNVDRYFVPFKENGGYNSLGITPQKIFDTVEGSLDNSGIPLGSETAVWNDFGEKYNYGFETINAGIERSFPASAVALWNGLNGYGSRYDSLAPENVAIAQEYTSSWLRDRSPKLTGEQALDILLGTASHRTFKLDDGNEVPKLIAAPGDINDPMGWDPIDMAAAFQRADELSKQQLFADKGVMHLQ